MAPVLTSINNRRLCKVFFPRRLNNHVTKKKNFVLSVAKQHKEGFTKKVLRSKTLFCEAKLRIINFV